MNKQDNFPNEGAENQDDSLIIAGSQAFDGADVAQGGDYGQGDYAQGGDYGQGYYAQGGGTSQQGDFADTTQPISNVNPVVSGNQSQQDADRPFPGATWTHQPEGQDAAARPHRGWIVAVVAIVAVFILLVLLIASCTAAVGEFIGGTSSGWETSYDAISADSVAIIELDGTIEYDGTTCSPEGFKEQLDNAANNRSIKAVVIRVDSGGGTAAAGEEMTDYLTDFIKTTGKPVVVSSASMNASAAYMISSQADYIYTLGSTSIGSIGTAMQFTDMSGFYELLGIDIDTIASSDSKDSTYGTRALSDEEREHYQAMVDRINDAFIEAVASGRHMSVDEVRELATGLAFDGYEAVSNGLADEIGTLDDAIVKACELAGLSSCDVVYLRSSSSDLYDLLDLFSEDNSTGLGATVENSHSLGGF